ncbi:hypothetical protein FLA_5084 [Filimonas lacunae]|nr:hypothetical protein FLA_5084 [Filimonas lacunae]
MNNAYCQERSYSDIADSVYSALDKKEVGYLLPLMDDSCVISSLPRGMNARVVPLLLAKYPPVKAYKIIAVDKETTGTRVKMEVMYDGGKAAYPDFLLNSGGRIAELNVVKSAALNEHKSAVHVLTAPDTLSLPFIIKDDRVYIKAEVDGRKGLFLLDTGSPEMILNRAYFADSLKLLAANTATEAGAHSKAEGIWMRRVNAFTAGRMRLTNFMSMVMTTGAVGGDGALPFLGSIGYNTLRDFEIRFDIAAGKITLVKTDVLGDYTSQQYRPANITYMGPVEMRRHIPVIMVTIGDQPFRMGIDCSITNTVLFARHKNAVLPFMEHVADVAAERENVQPERIKGTVGKMKIGSLDFNNMPVVVEGNSQVYDGVTDTYPLDGLLGLDFLKSYKTAINFKRKLIYFR